MLRGFGATHAHYVSDDATRVADRENVSKGLDLPLSDVDLVFADLQDAYDQLERASSSPRNVRTCFSRFVDLTQRLTSAMRKEAAKSGIVWQASRFDGWNEVTALFKQLRNEEQHERPIYISVFETRMFEPDGPEGAVIEISGTWQLTDQLLERPPDWLRLFDSDPETGQMKKDEISSCGVAYRYLIQPRDESLTARIREVGSADLHKLAATCMKILSAYHAFYCSSTGA